MKIRLFIFTNLFFILYAACDLLGLFVAQGIVTGFLVVLIPGLSWTLASLSGRRDALLTLVLAVFVSSAISSIGLLFFRILPVEVSRWGYVGYLFLASNAGVVLLKKNTDFKLDRCWVAVFLGAVLILVVNAGRMPVVHDQDVHFTTPAYGLIHELKPYKNMSQVPYAFAHPTWPHFISACSVFLMDELETVKRNYLEAKSIEGRFERDEIWKMWDKIPGTEESKEQERLFEERKLLFSARIPHLFLAGLVLVLLFEIVKRQTRSPLLGFLAVILLLSPELIVRFSYAGYTAATLFIMLSLCYVYLYHYSAFGTVFVLSLCAAWINQKAVFLPVSIAITDLASVREKGRHAWLWACAGYAVGLAVFALYGWLLNWECFKHVFLIGHGVPGLLQGLQNLPGFLAAWTKAALSMNTVIFILGVFWFSKKTFGTTLFVIPAWFWVGSTAFIIAKWPHVKNCNLVYPPLVIALVLFLANQRSALRRAVIGTILILYIINHVLMYKTLVDPNRFYARNESELGHTPRTVLVEYWRLHIP
jgi:hypothetical protein